MPAPTRAGTSPRWGRPRPQSALAAACLGLVLLPAAGEAGATGLERPEHLQTPRPESPPQNTCLVVACLVCRASFAGRGMAVADATRRFMLAVPLRPKTQSWVGLLGERAAQRRDEGAALGVGKRHVALVQRADPDGMLRFRVVGVPRDDVPVHVGQEVAEAGIVDPHRRDVRA